MNNLTSRHFQQSRQHNSLEIGDVVVAQGRSVSNGRVVNGDRAFLSVIVGHYFIDGKLTGFATIALRKGDNQNDLSCVNLGRDDFYDGFETTNGYLDTKSLLVKHVNDVDLYKGAIGTLKPAVIPDIIAARAIALSEGQFCEEPLIDVINIDGDAEYDGLYFYPDFLNTNSKITQQPDIEYQRSISIKRSNTIIDQSDIDAITRWAVKYANLCEKDPALFAHRPKTASWPSWTDIPSKSERDTYCCSLAKRDKRPSVLENLRLL
jgi:hypothetical protein